MAETSSGQLAFIEEVTGGITPATPAFSLIDFTQENLRLNKSNIRSNSVTPQRVVAASRATSQEVGNGFTNELVYGPEVDALFAALMGNAWASNVVKAGGSVIDYFTFERKISAAMYRRFLGCRIGTLDLNITPEQYITAQWGLVGASMDADTAIITGATYAAASTEAKLTALDVASLTLSNGMTGTFDYEAFTLKIDNNLTPSKRIGPDSVRGVRAGQCVVTGQMRVYIDNNDFANAFNNETNFDFAVAVSNGGKGYTFTGEKVAITGLEEGNPGNSQEFIATVDFECILDTAAATSFSITRDPT